MTNHISDSVRFFIIAMRARRKDLGLTQQEVADRSGVSLVTVNQIEGSRRPEPEMSSLEKIARAVNYTVEDLISLGRSMDDADMQKFRVSLGAEIGRQRELRAMTKNAVAARIGMSGTHLANIEAGVSSPTADKLFQIARSLGVSLEEIIRQAQNNMYK